MQMSQQTGGVGLQTDGSRTADYLQRERLALTFLHTDAASSEEEEELLPG